MRNKKKLPWIIAGVLAILLIVVTMLWVDALKRLNQGNMTEQRDLIREYCTKSDEENKRLCQKELEDLGKMLQDFAKESSNAAEQPPKKQPVASSTIQVQSKATTTAQ